MYKFILKKIIRNIISEEIGRNYRTLENDPYSWADHPDINTIMYSNGDQYSCKVECKSQPSLSTDLYSFPNEQEAQHWMRKKAEEIINIVSNKK